MPLHNEDIIRKYSLAAEGTQTGICFITMTSCGQNKAWSSTVSGGTVK